jgi:hypothetical protein
MAESIADAGGVDEKLPEGVLSEWYPGISTYSWWTLLGGLLAGVGALGYLWVASGARMPTGFSVNLVLAVVLLGALAAIHEGLHGLAILAIGARPQFGILRLRRAHVGFYTTAPGHRFSRRRYLIMCLAPLAVIAPVGVVLCALPVGSVLWFPFGAHLGGCIGDLTLVRQILRMPGDAVFEDLRDGLRIWSGPAVR